ncbi:3-oxoacyl-ACP synthase [Natroniella sp. ANB-PHB2]|uniref:3-oxoacyl-ACP synthase n=1 Tax=Natroniella sp. ANB-PHB2 TaxID=3384444 RepID=UPI0038D49FB5
MKEKPKIGIVGTGVYLPEERITAEEIAEKTEGVWAAEAIEEKLGISEKVIPGSDDGTQEMGVRAGLDALENTGVDPKDIDVILCIGEEWKEYPLTTSGIYIQEQIGATNAWAIDVQQRCCTTVSAMKIAQDMMIADDEIETVMIVGGYRNSDFVDYSDPDLSMMYNLGAGGGAIILQKNYDQNLLLGTQIITDGSLARDAGVKYGGTKHPITEENLDKAYKLNIFDPEHMKSRLKEVSMKNWFECIEKAFAKADIPQEELDYLAVLHFKRSMHEYMLEELGLEDEGSIYLNEYGHLGQIDQILSIHLALEEGKIEDGTVISMIAAGIGYVWAANVIRWGKC